MWTRIMMSTAAVAAAAENPSLVLLQQTVEMKVLNDDAMGIGSSAPVSEAGYQLVASMKSDEETAIFIARVAAAEARTITDAGSLAGLVPYYSGRLGVQSLDSLKNELRAAPWVGEGLGRSSPLNEDGYKAVADMNDEAHMMAFARRILDSHGKKSQDDSMLKGLVPWFNGQKATQTFDNLEGELLNATWTEPRVKVEVALAEQEHKDKKPVEVHVSKEEAPDEDAGNTVETTMVTTVETTMVTTVETTVVTTLPPSEDEPEALVNEGVHVEHDLAQDGDQFEHSDVEVESLEGEHEVEDTEREEDLAVVEEPPLGDASVESEAEVLVGAELHVEQESEKHEQAQESDRKVDVEEKGPEKEDENLKGEMLSEKRAALVKKEEEAIRNNAPKADENHEKVEKEKAKADETKPHGDNEKQVEETTPEKPSAETKEPEVSDNATVSTESNVGKAVTNEGRANDVSASDTEGSKKKSWFSWLKR